jgi:isoleucyl-tRNA synthetase
VVKRLKPDFRALGPDFGSRTPAVARAIEQSDPEVVADSLAARGAADVVVDGARISVTPQHVQVLEEARTGWQVASEGGYSVALDLDVDEVLRREGLARELVRALNDLRKRRGLELADRIVLDVDAAGEAAAVLDVHGEEIAHEVLATQLRRGAADGGEELGIGDGLVLRVRLERAP